MKPMDIGVMMGVGENPLERLQRVKAMEVPTVQMGAPGEDFMTGQPLADLKAAIKQTGIEVTTVFCGFPGEHYADIPTVRRTVGLVPPATRADRLERTQRISDFARSLGVDSISMHIGFVPEDPANPGYAEVVKAAQQVCDYCAKQGQSFRLETGQETGECLKRFIENVARPNLGVNFDPANMILYGSGEPIAALELVGKHVQGVHCKDGKWPTEKDQLGHEVPLGQGEVGIERFVQTLWKVGYRGALTIEREISGEQQLQDIMAAKKLLEGIRAKVMGAG